MNLNSHTEPSPVSVIIVNYNAGELLEKCLASCLGQAKEIIVIDNASSDSSLTSAYAYATMHLHFKIITNATNVGFAAGCNIGIGAANQPYLLFLNPDSEVTPGAVATLVRVLESDAAIGMAGGLLANGDGTEQSGGRRTIPTPWSSFVRVFGFHRLAKWCPRWFLNFNLHEQPLPDRPVDVEAISGAVMMVRRDAIPIVGLWDEGYFLHCEDLDWCMRFRLHGWRVVFVSDATVMHRKGGCSRSRPIFVEWHKHKGMVRFYRKFFRRQYPGVVMLLVVFGVWLHFAAVAVYYSAVQLRRLMGAGHD